MNWKSDRTTIFAPASGSGRAAISVIRISGPNSAQAIAVLAGGLPKPRLAAYRRLRDAAGATLDHAIVLWFPGPNSFTGEDSVELHVHGSRAVVRAVLDQLARIEGLRPALAGEFARRAVLNGKMRLPDAEALADLIDSETEQQRLAALRLRDGELGRRVESWRSLILNASAELEANIDFSDEDDVDRVDWAGITRKLDVVLTDMAAALESSARARRLRDGLTVVLAGAPNVGKSSLLNALSERDSAIISAIPGTTRDAIEVALEIGGYAVVLVDTAGLRETDDAIESEGIARTRKRIQHADLVLWLDDGSGAVCQEEFGADTPIWRLASKADLRELNDSTPFQFPISTVAGMNIAELLHRIGQFAADHCHSDGFEVRKKDHDAIEIARSALARVVHEGWGLPIEIAAEELRVARLALTDLSSAMDSEAVFDEVFSRFCIGK